MLKYDFENSVGYWVVMTANALERALNEELVPHGITYRQWQVLAWLALEAELCQAELAQRMRIEPPSLVRILDRMEEAGWVCRRECPSDRRKKIVSATSKAKPVWSKVIRCARRVRQRATAGFSQRELKQLEATLLGIRENLKATHKAPTRTGTS